MNIYISGISGTGMGPLALMAKSAGFNVSGSDLNKGAIYDELIKAGIEIKIGPQDGEFLKSKLNSGIDWFVYTSALPENHEELLLAKASNIRCSKRDDFTAFLIDKLGLKLVAVSGTHGKTTTTSMLIWAAKNLNLPASYIVGTTLGFAPSGAYHNGDEYFIYEADEYDRNFLKYHPWLAIIPSMTFDHSDIYKNPADYQAAFRQFENQSQNVVKKGIDENKFNLSGKVRRIDAGLAAAALKIISPATKEEDIITILNDFPGVGRRLEKLTDGLYTDYAHHPEEIAATIEIAKEEMQKTGKKGLVVLYQPHQNTRQYEIKNAYKKAFLGADKIFWIPTYLVREDESLKIITPTEFIQGLENKEIASPAALDENFKHQIENLLRDNFLVILMTAGPADVWLRQNFS